MGEISRLVYHCNSYALEAKSQANVDDSSIEEEKCASFLVGLKGVEALGYTLSGSYQHTKLCDFVCYRNR
jgi:hypothetical protein